LEDGFDRKPGPQHFRQGGESDRRRNDIGDCLDDFACELVGILDMPDLQYRVDGDELGLQHRDLREVFTQAAVLVQSPSDVRPQIRAGLVRSLDEDTIQA